MRCKLIRIEGMNGNGGRWSCNTSPSSSTVTIASAVVQFGSTVFASQCHYYYYYCLGRAQHSLITFDVVLSLVHRLHSVFALVMFYVKSGLLQVFGITEFADESQERWEWKGVWIGGGKGNVGLGVGRRLKCSVSSYNHISFLPSPYNPPPKHLYIMASSFYS